MFIRKSSDVIYIDNLLNNLLTNTEVKEDYEVWNYLGAYDMFPVTNFNMSMNRATINNLEGQTSLCLKWLPKYEARRKLENIFYVKHWYFAVVFYNSNPIILLRSPDVRNDGYSKMFILDKDNHQRATGFIFDHIESDPGPELEMWGLDAPSGSFGGDVQPHVRSMHYDPASCFDYKNSDDKKELSYLLNYTVDPHFNWEEVGGYNPV